jgi:hypothetical protein
MPKTSLTVYALELPGIRKIVAAPSYPHAAKLLNVSAYILKTYGGITSSSSEKKVALDDPGAVFARGVDEDGWTKITSSSKSRRLPPHGGPRQSGGKPREAETVAIPRAVRLSDAHYAAFHALGGVAWFRRELRQGKVIEGQELKASWNIPGTAGIRSIRLSAEDHARFITLGGTRWLRMRIEQTAPEHAPHDSEDGRLKDSSEP